MNGKSIIVTGAATGIGRAITSRLLASGAGVLAVDVDEEGLDSLETESDEDIRIHVADLADAAAASGIVNAALAAFDGIDGLVNNAAYIPRSNIETTTTEIFNRVIAVNVRAPLLLIKTALPYLTDRKGCVLNIGSINAYSGEPGLLAYSISKGALQTLSRNLGDALHREYGVRVNHINPGWVLTENEIRYKTDDGLPRDWATRLPKEFNPSGGLIKPETVAEAAFFWLDDSSSPISGSVIDLEQFPVIGRNPTKRIED